MLEKLNALINLLNKQQYGTFLKSNLETDKAQYGTFLKLIPEINECLKLLAKENIYLSQANNAYESLVKTRETFNIKFSEKAYFKITYNNDEKVTKISIKKADETTKQENLNLESEFTTYQINISDLIRLLRTKSDNPIECLETFQKIHKYLENIAIEMVFTQTFDEVYKFFKSSRDQTDKEIIELIINGINDINRIIPAFKGTPTPLIDARIEILIILMDAIKKFNDEIIAYDEDCQKNNNEAIYFTASILSKIKQILIISYIRSLFRGGFYERITNPAKYPAENAILTTPILYYKFPAFLRKTEKTENHLAATLNNIIKKIDENPKYSFLKNEILTESEEILIHQTLYMFADFIPEINNEQKITENILPSIERIQEITNSIPISLNNPEDAKKIVESAVIEAKDKEKRRTQSNSNIEEELEKRKREREEAEQTKNEENNIEFLKKREEILNQRSSTINVNNSNILIGPPPKSPPPPIPSSMNNPNILLHNPSENQNKKPETSSVQRPLPKPPNSNNLQIN